MPTDKAKVTSYLGDEEKAVFDKLCKENGFSNSEGVAHLVREQLMGGAEVADNERRLEGLNDRIGFLYERVDSISEHFSSLIDSQGRQGKVIADLEHKLSCLESRLIESTPDYFLDEEIASVTGRREQEVYEWRMGLRKPRGERILRKLEPYEVKDGRWVKKKVAE